MSSRSRKKKAVKKKETYVDHDETENRTSNRQHSKKNLSSMLYKKQQFMFTTCVILKDVDHILSQYRVVSYYLIRQIKACHQTRFQNMVDNN